MLITRILCIIALITSPFALGAADDEVLTLQLRFHITQGAAMTVKEQKMEAWTKPDDQQGAVLTEVNRIWKQANIQFVIERIQEEPLLSPPNRDELLSIGRLMGGNVKGNALKPEEIVRARSIALRNISVAAINII